MRRFLLVTLAGGAFAATFLPGVSAGASLTAPPSAAISSGNAIGAAAEVVQATVGSATVAVVEPPFKPPATWRYEPAALTVKLGTTVMWTNTGAVVHTVTADDGKTFDSRDIQPKAIFGFTPSSAGSFDYHCAYHPWMKGTIIVQP